MDSSAPHQHGFETHITVAASDPDTLTAVASYIASRQMKWTQIVLDAGDSPNQPMITFWGQSNLNDQLARACELTHDLKRLGCSVVRTKVEAPIESAVSDCPTDQEEVTPTERYFEHHVKLLLEPGTDIDVLSGLSCRFGARLSRNARRQRSDGRLERFATLRNRTSKSESLSALQDLLNALEDADFTVLEVESEHVLVDTNYGIDAGWI